METLPLSGHKKHLWFTLLTSPSVWDMCRHELIGVYVDNRRALHQIKWSQNGVSTQISFDKKTSFTKVMRTGGVYVF